MVLEPHPRGVFGAHHFLGNGQVLTEGEFQVSGKVFVGASCS